MYVLGIETSFDDTSIGLYSNSGLVTNKIRHQRKFHDIYGGTVPEISSREHIKKTIFLVKEALSELGNFNKIEAISYTAGPGLVGSLLVGASIAYSLSLGWNIPVIPVNHLEGHLLSPMLDYKNNVKYPFIGLLISGGNTQLINAFSFGKYRILGKTLDDSIGEVFDKISRLLGLSYPWGPSLSKLAKKGKYLNLNFPKPMINSKDLNFSFSGLKTFVSKVFNKKKNSINQKFISDLAFSFENSVIDILISKSKRALEFTGYKNLVVVGGVSANKNLRMRMKKSLEEVGKHVFFPKKEFSVDNGAMIALIGFMRIRKNLNNINYYLNNSKIFVDPNWSIEDIFNIY